MKQNAVPFRTSRCLRATCQVCVLAMGALTVSLSAYAANTDAAGRCQAIAGLKLDGVAIIAAKFIDTGRFTLAGESSAIAGLPAFCRVAATLRPTPDSNIKIELWMPEQDWNGRFLGTGNGGGAGKIDYHALVSGIQRGYATANTDMGTSPNANTAVGHPERWIDFGYRSTHEMTSVSKQILERYYEKPESRSYFVGCSTGGGQALMEAQRFPDDYNGIIAGAPANNRTHVHTGLLWNMQVTNLAPGVHLSPETVAFITKSVLAACVGKDGGAPGDDFLTDPRE